MTNKIEHVQMPDEVKFSLNSVCNAWPKHAELKEGDVILKGLSSEQKLSLSLFYIVSEVDEVIDNINIVLGDLARLRSDHAAFGDFNPFARYKLLVRTYSYEYARFEDLFGYFTHWCTQEKLLTKQQRKELRNEFYIANQKAIQSRNILMHDIASWKGHCTPELSLLQGADLFGLEVRDKDDKLLTWKNHLSPICEKMIKTCYSEGHEIRTFWSMVVANMVYFLVKDGRLKKAGKKFQPTEAVRRSA